jgi:hypothetical protein
MQNFFRKKGGKSVFFSEKPYFCATRSSAWQALREQGAFYLTLVLF